MKLINFRCIGYDIECHYEEEELFADSEKPPTMLTHFCPMCGGILRKFNLKNNPQRAYIQDPMKGTK